MCRTHDTADTKRDSAVINCGLSSGRITVKASFQFRFRHKKSLLLITVTYVLFVIIRRDVRFQSKPQVSVYTDPREKASLFSAACSDCSDMSAPPASVCPKIRLFQTVNGFLLYSQALLECLNICLKTFHILFHRLQAGARIAPEHSGGQVIAQRLSVLT